MAEEEKFYSQIPKDHSEADMKRGMALFHCLLDKGKQVSWTSTGIHLTAHRLLIQPPYNQFCLKGMRKYNTVDEFGKDILKNRQSEFKDVLQLLKQTVINF